jgi:hypothetical protein
MEKKKSNIHAHFGLHVSGYHKHGKEEKRKIQKNLFSENLEEKDQ